MLDRNHPSRIYRIPTTVWRLVDYIVHAGLQVENVFILAASPEIEKLIVSCLDANEPFPESLSESSRFRCMPLTSVGNDLGVISAGQILLQYLEALPEPLISENITDALVHSIDAGALENLPERNFELLDYITTFIRHKILHHNKSLTPYMLGNRVCCLMFNHCSDGPKSGHIRSKVL